MSSDIVRGCPNPNCGFDLKAHNTNDLQYCLAAANIILLREIRDLLALRDEQPVHPVEIRPVPPKGRTSHAA